MLSLTHLEKIFWPDEGFTKGDLIKFYNEISSVILPYLKDRPMVLNRHPDGISGKSFFQKNISEQKSPSFLHTEIIFHREKAVRYLLVQNVQTLLYVANFGCIELNPFHSRMESLTCPDYLLIDLDPENVRFELVVECALVIHDLLEELQIKNLCKTSGGRGLHIYIPLGAKYSFEEAHSMAKIIALLAQKKLPQLISLERNPSKRQKKIYIDVPRNSPKQTIAAPYCVRPRPGAPVSTPLLWEEVTTKIHPLDYNLLTVPKRINEVGDIFKPVIGRGINMEKALRTMARMLK